MEFHNILIRRQNALNFRLLFQWKCCVKYMLTLQIEGVISNSCSVHILKKVSYYVHQAIQNKAHGTHYSVSVKSFYVQSNCSPNIEFTFKTCSVQSLCPSKTSNFGKQTLNGFEDGCMQGDTHYVWVHI